MICVPRTTTGSHRICRVGCRTRPDHILTGTGDLEMVRVLLGHAKLDSTSKFLGIAKKSDPIAICRAFDI